MARSRAADSAEASSAAGTPPADEDEDEDKDEGLLGFCIREPLLPRPQNNMFVGLGYFALR